MDYTFSTVTLTGYLNFEGGHLEKFPQPQVYAGIIA